MSFHLLDLQVATNAHADYSSMFYWLLFWILVFFVLPLFFSDYFQLWRLSYGVGGLLSFLSKVLRFNFSSITSNVEQIVKSKTGKEPDRSKIEESVKNLIEYVVIEPTTLETQGLVAKLKHIVSIYNERIEEYVKSIMPQIERPIIQNFVNAIQALRELNYIYKVINHYYRLALKYRNPYPLVQIYVLMPFIKETANALSNSIQTFIKGHPIGDSAGPMVAYKFMHEKCTSIEEISHSIKDTYIAKCIYNGRKVYVIKALGPGGTVGHLDDAVLYLIEKMHVRPRLVITVDAALKLEGEKTGTITEGIGVAIGGIGIEKFNIESIATKYGIPVYAILIKMSVQEALTSITKDIIDATNRATERVCQVIDTLSREGDEIILVGVGNTIGVGQ